MVLLELFIQAGTAAVLIDDGYEDSVQANQSYLALFIGLRDTQGRLCVTNLLEGHAF